MLSKLRPSSINRCSLQVLESHLHTACTLLQSGEGDGQGNNSETKKSQGTRSAGPAAGPTATDNNDKHVQRRDGGRQGPGGPAGADGPARRQQQQQRGPRNNNQQQRGVGKQRQGGGGGGVGTNTNIIQAALGLGRPAVAAPSDGGDASVAQAMAPYVMNNDMLRVSDYIISSEDVSRLKDNRLGGEDRKTLAAKIKTAVVRSPEQVSRMIQADMKMDSDPNFRIEDVLLGGRNLNLNSSSTSTEAEIASLEETLDLRKDELCFLLGLTETEFEQYKKEAAQEFAATALPTLQKQDPRVKEHELDSLLEEMPQHHKNYAAALSKLRVLQGNPNWSHEKKVIFARRLVRDLS